MQVPKFWLATNQSHPLTLGQSIWMLVTDVNQLSTLANDLFTHVRLTPTTRDRLVP